MSVRPKSVFGIVDKDINNWFGLDPVIEWLDSFVKCAITLEDNVHDPRKGILKSIHQNFVVKRVSLIKKLIHVFHDPWNAVIMKIVHAYRDKYSAFGGMLTNPIARDSRFHNLSFCEDICS